MTDWRFEPTNLKQELRNGVLHFTNEQMFSSPYDGNTTTNYDHTMLFDFRVIDPCRAANNLYQQNYEF